MPNTPKEVFAVYSKDCLSCGHLVSGLPKRKKSCIYPMDGNKGNTKCPAAEVVIVSTGRLHELAKQLLSARSKQEAAAEAELLSEVAKQTAENQIVFYRILDKLSNKLTRSR